MKLIILDRDGVINYDSDEYIKTEEEWTPIPGSLEAIAKLTHEGYHVVVISNQAGLARGKITLENLNRIHRKMHTLVSQYGGKIEAIFFCPHGPDDQCDCRKPKPGLFKEISKRLHAPLDGVIVIGDKLSDIQAALFVGAKPVLVKTGYGQQFIDAGEVPDDIPVYDDLAAAVDAML